MFVVNVIYKKPLDVVDHYLKAHRDYLEEGYQNNYFIVSGPKNPREGGIILSSLQNKAKLLEVLHADPFYVHGVADYEITEFAPVKYHKDFAVFVPG